MDDEKTYTQAEVEELLIEVLDELHPTVRTDHRSIVITLLRKIGWSDTHIALYIKGELIY